MIKQFLTVFMLCAVFMWAFSPISLNAQVKVGQEVLETFQTEHPYAAKRGVAWEKFFTYPNSAYIAIHFSKFNLNPGDYVEISSPDGRFSHIYREKGKSVRGGRHVLSSFWASYIPGDTAIVRLHVKGNKSAYGFVIDKWVRGYEPEYVEALISTMDGGDNQTEAICNADDKEWAKCYSGTEMYNKSRAVSRLLINGSSACTGWLLGSQGHLVTNNHCIDAQSDADNTDYEFMAEGATCAANCSSWGACPGTVAASSGTMVKTSSTLDYTLILLPTNLSATYGYMQLRNALPTVGERIYIPQHPAAKGKMLAVNSDQDSGYAKVYSTNEAPCMGGPGDIGYYADTEGGSSGSPVLGYNDNLVVALHHCANCPNRGVPIPSIITDLGASLPANAIGNSGPNPPVAGFSANNTTVQVGGTVQFTDLSSNSPTSWAWTFNGGTPSSSSVQNPAVTYNTPGVYTVSLTAANAYGNNTNTKTNYITVSNSGVTYCATSGNNQNYEYIAGVTVGDMINTSTASPYTDFTNKTAHLTAGSSVSLKLTPGFSGSAYNEYWVIWIDYNKDGDFTDSGEQVYSGSGGGVLNGSFTVPGSADGATRMRVTMKYGSAATSCGTFDYGEAEDYAVEISAGQVLPPVANFTANVVTIFTGQSVAFTDQSSQNPTSWSWSFPGGTPSSSSSRNPSVVYNTAGVYSVTLTASNSAGSDSETKTNYITVNNQSVQYCSAASTNPNYEYIKTVQVGAFSNTSAGTTYSDFTAKIVALTPGATISVTLTPGFSGSSYTEFWKIWIDYNKDGDFADAGEEVFSKSAQTAVTGTFVVPSGLTGTTRMRVVMRYYTAPASCGSFTYGEVEDYTASF